MSISKRIFLYSFSIVAVVVVLILTYFTGMLSHLYANQIENDRRAIIKEVQQAQLNQKADGVQKALVQFDTPNAILGVTLPKKGNQVVINSIFKQYQVELLDQDVKQTYQELIQLLAQMKDLSNKEQQQAFKKLGKKVQQLATDKGLTKTIPQELVKIQELGPALPFDELFSVGQNQVHVISEDQLIMEAMISDKTNTYSTYLGVSQDATSYYFVIATALTPKMTALQQVILNSLPMIIVVLLVVVILASLLLSKILIQPLKKVSKMMSDMKAERYPTTNPPDIQGPLDEYQQLEQDLTGLYQELATQKAVLANQNQKQKVFLAATSHQLKTPVTAALLLVEGMMAEVGRYKDTKAYLPEVKRKMLDIQVLINEILAIDQQTKKTVELVKVSLNQLLSQGIQRHQDLIETKELTVTQTIDPTIWLYTDRLYLDKIVDNLVLNAVTYTPNRQIIEITGNQSQLIIRNYGTQLPEDYLPKLFEPFVRPSQTTKGHGLGLYLVAQYAQMLNVTVTLTNSEDQKCVVTTLTF